MTPDEAAPAPPLTVVRSYFFFLTSAGWFSIIAGSDTSAEFVLFELCGSFFEWPTGSHQTATSCALDRRLTAAQALIPIAAAKPQGRRRSLVFEGCDFSIVRRVNAAGLESNSAPPRFRDESLEPFKFWSKS